jgi:hypothetical protein
MGKGARGASGCHHDDRQPGVGTFGYRAVGGRDPSLGGSVPAAAVWHCGVGAYLDAASTAVTELGGKVAKKLGDGLMALFGYPVAQIRINRWSFCQG